MKKLILIIMLMLVLPISIVKADKVDKVIYQTSFETEEERNFWDLTGDLAGDGNVWQYKSSEQNADYTAQDGIYSLYFTGISEEYYSESLAISNPITINNFNPDRQHIKLNWYVSYSGRTIYPYSVYIFKGDETTENIISAVKYIGDYQGVFSSLISNAYYYKWVDITDKLNEWYPDDSEEKTIRIVFKSSMLSGTEVKIDAVSIGIYAGLEIKNYTFEDGLEGWTPIDYDGDGHNWEISYDKLANNGGNYITSASYDFEAFTPENYIISPKIKIDSKYDEVKLEWYVGARSDEYFKEHYSVYVYSGTEELTKDNVKEQLADESISQKLHEETLSTYEFVLKTSQLDEKFIGKEVQIIFVHHDCTDIYWLKVDDVALYGYITEESSSGGIAGGDITGGETPPTEDEVVLGDWNGNGKYTLIDLIQYRLYMVNPTQISAELLARVDLTKDGKLSLVDLIAARKLLVGLPIK